MKKTSPPPPPLMRYISMESAEFCPLCKSTMMRKAYIIFGRRPGCIHPECKNYGGAKL